MNNVSYRLLKANIRKACKVTNKITKEFEVDNAKLTSLLDDVNLIPLPVGLKSKRVKEDIIPYLSEYYEKSYLTWFSDKKQYTILTFVDKTMLDDAGLELVNSLINNKENIDRVHTMAKIIAEYHCYFATVISYAYADRETNIPSISYNIACRANKVVIKDSDYQYNHKDFS